jgi:hypothetical protein
MDRFAQQNAMRPAPARASHSGVFPGVRTDLAYDTAAPPGERPGGAADGTGRGRRGLGLLPGFGAGGQPISSRALPLVSFTNFSTKGMERAAKTV